MADIPSKPPDVDKIDPLPAVDPHGKDDKPPEDGKFASYMKESAETTTQPTTQNQISPMELSEQGKINAGKPPTAESIQNQMNTVAGSLGDIKNHLHTKGLKLKQSQKYLLRNKLSSANEHIRQAAKKVGVETGPPPDLSGKKSPIAKFLTLVADGQHQLNSAASQIKNLDTSGKKLNAGELLLVQVKLQKAQQELDYSSVLLGKAVDVVKQLFNIQI